MVDAEGLTLDRKAPAGAMDQAGLLNSMQDHELLETCKRLQRGYDDMSMLLSEFEEERGLLRREQEKLRHKIEKVTQQAEHGTNDKGVFWNFVNDLDQQLKISPIFKALEERQAAKRRKLCLPAPHTPGTAHASHASNATGASPQLGDGANGVAQDEEEAGPFSDLNVQMSWGCDVSLGALRQASASKDSSIDELHRWVRETLCSESVAEAEAIHDSAELWAAQWRNQLVGGDPDAVPVDPLVDPARQLVEGGGPFGEDAVGPVQEGFTHAKRPSASEGAATLLGWVPELFTGPSSQGDAPVSSASFTVVLRRSSTGEYWGLGWQSGEFKQNKVRIVERLTPDSVADKWNQRQTEIDHPELCIRPQDRLTSVNGKTNRSEMSAEIVNGIEVVLEFHRYVPQDVTPVTSPSGQRSQQRQTPDTGDRSSHPSTRRTPFSKRLPDYFKEAVGRAPSGDLELAAATPPRVKSPQPTRQAQAEPRKAAPAASAQETTAIAGRDVDTPHSGGAVGGGLQGAPYGLVAQVMSLGRGEVRLSWLFDWDAAPPDLADPERGLSRSFEVLQRREATDSEDAENVARPSSRSMLGLELRAGFIYSFEVRAVLSDEQGGGDSVAGCTRLWTSPPSTAAAVDLRGPKGRFAPRGRASESHVAAEAGHPHSADELGCTEVPAPTTDEAQAVVIAAAGATVSAPAVETRGTSAGTTASTGALSAGAAAPRPSGIAARQGGVASRLGTFLAKRPAVPVAATIAEATAVAPDASAPTTAAPTAALSAALAAAPTASPAAAPAATPPPGPDSPVAAGPPGAVVDNPLATSKPRVVASRPLDPAWEKRDIAGRLRIRRGGPLVTREEETLEQKLRSMGVDSDDEGSLQRLSSALSTLERTAGASKLAAPPSPSGGNTGAAGSDSLGERRDGGR